MFFIQIKINFFYINKFLNICLNLFVKYFIKKKKKNVLKTNFLKEKDSKILF